MTICWYCHWGWPKPVADIYDAALKKLDGYDHPLHYGPSHIVWDDENFEDENIQFCLDQLDVPFFKERFSQTELEIVKESLLALQSIPLEIRCPPGSEIETDEPNLYPPPSNMEMVKR
jgi:hypothetical protein